MAGRREKDSIAKALTDDQHAKAVPVHIPASAPPMPEYFKKSQSLPEVWNFIVSDFERINVLAKTDGALIETLCVLLDQFRRMTVFLIENGETYQVKTKTDSRSFKRPEYDIRKDTLLRLQSMLIELGATPASRSKVSSLLQGDLFGADAKKNSWNGFGAKAN